MNLTEASKLVGAVKGLCPSQKVDDFTPAAWEMALAGITYRDALAALRVLAQRPAEPGRSTYIEPGHIRWEVGKLRSERRDKHPTIEPPAGLNGRESIDWQRALRERISSGEVIEPPELGARPLPGCAAITKGMNEA